MKKSPLKNKVNTVFIPVENIEMAKDWYAQIFGLEGEVQFSHLFVASTEGAGVILDTMPMWRNENGRLPKLDVPAIQFATDNIYESYQFMKEHGVELVTEIKHEQFFVIKDPDGNMLMICQD